MLTRRSCLTGLHRFVISRRPQISLRPSFSGQGIAALPARTHAKANAYAARTNANSDARTVIVVAAIVISAPFDVAFAGRVVVGITNDNAACTAFAPAA